MADQDVQDTPLSAAISSEDPDNQGQVFDTLGSLTDLHSKVLDNQGKMADNSAKQAQTQGIWQNIRSKKTLGDALGTFLFSLGQGIQASQSAPGSRGTMAGLGAAISGGGGYQEMMQQRQLNQARIADMAAQAQQRQQSAQRIPLIDPQTQQPLLDATGQPMMLDPKTAANIQVGLRRVQTTGNTAADKLAFQKEKQKQLNEQYYLKQGYQITGFDENGVPQVKPLADDQLPATIQLARQKEQRMWYEQGMKMDYSQYPPKPVPIPEDSPEFPVRLKMKRDEDAQRADYQQSLAQYRQAQLQANAQNRDLARQRLEQSGARLANTVFDPAMDSDTRLRTMLDAAGDNFNGKGGQSDLSLIFNHIGMTLSAQKGARINNAEIERAISTPGEESAPVQKLAALYNYVKGGQLLTPDQRKEMVQNGIERRQNMWDQSRRKAYLDQLPTEPTQDTLLPPLQRQTVPPLQTPSTAPRGGGNVIPRQAQGGLKIGQVVNGRTYLGGPLNDRNSWK